MSVFGNTQNTAGNTASCYLFMLVFQWLAFMGLDSQNDAEVACGFVLALGSPYVPSPKLCTVNNLLALAGSRFCCLAALRRI